jgi:hypothetical protein
MTILDRVSERMLTQWAHRPMRHMDDFAFAHINKTGGSGIESALRLPFQLLTAMEMRDEFGADEWARRFTLAFVRNPWDKVASRYHYRVKTVQTGLGNGHLPFRDRVIAAYAELDPKYHNMLKMFMPQTGRTSDEQGRQIVTFVAKFEKLADDFRAVCDRIGRMANLPHLKASRNHDFRLRSDAVISEIIATRFASDIEAYGYSFK